MKISIIGSGNVGAAFGTALSLNGHDVLFYDIVAKTLPLRAGFTLDFGEAFDHADAMVICVPTELNAEGHCDLSILETVCRQYAQQAELRANNPILIQKSTCPPGTADRITAW